MHHEVNRGIGLKSANQVQLNPPPSFTPCNTRNTIAQELAQPTTDNWWVEESDLALNIPAMGKKTIRQRVTYGPNTLCIDHGESTTPRLR